MIFLNQQKPIYIELNNKVGRAGRYQTKGIALTFIEKDNEEEKNILKEIREKFVIDIPEITDDIDDSLLQNN